VAKLVYAAIASLDGYVADGDGDFGWAVPDREVHAFINDLQRPIGTHLYGRRMYEILVAWENPGSFAAGSAVMEDYAQVWQAADKIVYSRTLEGVGSARTRIERAFDPDAVRQLKAAAERDLSIGGPELAGQALAAGLVDEVHLLLAPVTLGGGRPALPDGVRLDLELLDQRRFASGTAYLRYATAAGAASASGSRDSR
jgi:dihydrofolate reductase